MSSLPSHLRALLDEARGEATATAGDLARVRASLMTRVVHEPVPIAVPSWLRAFLPALGVVAAGATAVGLWQHLPREVPQRPPVALLSTVCPAPPPPSSCPAAPAPARCPTAPMAVSTISGRSTGTTAPGPRAPEKAASGAQKERVFAPPVAPADRWILELGLLQDAQAALADRRALDALHHVENHLELFPTTRFREERLALHVLALCTLGRAELAEEPLDELRGLAPASTYLFRIRGSCPDALFGRETR